MNNMFRSKWLRSFLLFALVLSASNCGDESEVIIEAPDCPALDGFEGGVYSFTVNVDGITDGCADGAFNDLIDEGPYGPITLPAAADLPQDITLTLPFVGQVTGTLSLSGGALRLTVEDPIQVVGIVLPIVGAVDVTARVSGTLCPVSATRVDAALTVMVVDIDPEVPLITVPCTVGVPGTLQ
jgi:hypothetical protein